jgi:hypothetical protein
MKSVHHVVVLLLHNLEKSCLPFLHRHKIFHTIYMLFLFIQNVFVVAVMFPNVSYENVYCSS